MSPEDGQINDDLLNVENPTFDNGEVFKRKKLEEMSDEDIEDYTKKFFGDEIVHLSQDKINDRMKYLLVELSKRKINYFELLTFALPNSATEDEVMSGNSAFAKAYKALMYVYKTYDYKNNDSLKRIVRTLEEGIVQNPRMIGASAFWDIAKDVMWRKDIPHEAKSGLREMATYTLSFCPNSEHEEQLLSKLDFDNLEKYSETAHLLEAIKIFWLHASTGSQFADKVPNFYLNVLNKLGDNPSDNYLLSKKVDEIRQMLKKGISSFSYKNVSENELDVEPFEVSKGIFAYKSPFGSKYESHLGIIPSEEKEKLFSKVKEFKKIRSEMPQNNSLHNRMLIHNLSADIGSVKLIQIKDMLGGFEHIHEEEQEELISDYEYLVSKPMRRIIQEDFGFELKDLTLREQFYFLNYLKKTTNAEAKVMKEYIAEHGVDGMRAFLALERGSDDLGDKIIDFASNNKKEVAGKVFEYYVELLNSADNAEELIGKMSHCKLDGCGDAVEQVRENILNRAQKDFEKALDTSPEKLEDIIKNYVVHAKEYVALLQEVGDKDIEKISSRELSDEDKEQMRKLLKENYDSIYKGEEYEEFRKEVLDSLEKGFDNTNTVFNVLRDGDNIVSFNRFDTLVGTNGKEVTYFGSFNASLEYSGVGEVMLNKTIKEKLKDGKAMMAHCDPEQDISMKYIETGFVATSLIDFAKLPAFEIWALDNATSVFESKQMSKNDILDLIGSENTPFTIREKKEHEEYPELKQGGMVLTRYFKHNGKKYLVFEEMDTSIKEKFTFVEEGDENG